MKTNLLPIVLTVFTVLFSSCQKNELLVQSPDASIEVEINFDTLKGQQAVPMYCVVFNGKKIVQPSAIQFEINGRPVTQNLVVKSAKITRISNTWERVWGKSKVVNNNYNQLSLALQNTTTQDMFNIVFRVYNDAVAFRYTLPYKSEIDTVLLTKELSEFNFGSDHACWAVNFGRFYSAQEKEFDVRSLSAIHDTSILGMPVVIEIDKENYVGITEANLTDWAGMFLTKGTAENSIVTKLSPLPKQEGLLVKSVETRQSPWRVIMVGNNLGNLIETDILSNLNEPCAIENTHWIKPGKSAWDWWWCNSYAPDADFELGPNTETMKYFVDHAANMGWEYQLVDWQWYGEPFTKMPIGNLEADITTPNPNIDIPEIVQYANAKNVDILVWLHWEAARHQMEEAFPLYEKWGVKGVKVDFMNREDQEMVNFYHKLVKLAAKHHLLVDFHGAYKPTGWTRTYPNLVTREGILGNEYNKWSTRITLEHTVLIPFTRGLLGELDFTPGGYYNVHTENFKKERQSICPNVRGTRCHQLAMNIVYESVLQVMCGAPYNYRTYPQGNDFLTMVPTTWDETKFVDGYPGDFIITARRSGSDWYIGGMTDEQARQVSFKARFLENGNYKATFWKDDMVKSEEDPKNLMKQEMVVTSETELSIDMLRGGGFVIHLVKE